MLNLLVSIGYKMGDNSYQPTSQLTILVVIAFVEDLLKYYSDAIFKLLIIYYMTQQFWSDH